MPGCQSRDEELSPPEDEFGVAGPETALDCPAHSGRLGHLGDECVSATHPHKLRLSPRAIARSDTCLLVLD